MDLNKESLQNHEIESEELLKKLQVDSKQGLSTEEVNKRLEQYGKNIFEKKKKKSLVVKILEQLKDVSAIILIIAGVLSLALSIKEGEGFLEPIVIFAVVIMNLILAITQESSAEKSLESLSALSAPSARVIRNGNAIEIKAEDIVPGDIVMLKTGDLVPADARLLSSTNLAVDESALTGESEPAQKDANVKLNGNIPLGDMLNMVFEGCLVTAGNAVCVVTDTAMNTQMGKIAGFLNQTKEHKTPLQVRLDKVGKSVSGIAVIAAICMFVVGLLQHHDVWEMALVAVTLAVAAVPETLALIVTLSLTYGVKNMVQKNALIRKLQAVETLGSTSVICSDKTGTLTQNKMTVKKLWIASDEVIAESDDFNENYMNFLTRISLACDAKIGFTENGEEKIIGDPTETAILTLLKNKGILKSELDSQYKKVGLVPFSSERKMMTVVVECPDKSYLMLTKGALDRLPIKRKDYEYIKNIENIHDTFADDALRVIALASKKLESIPTEKELIKLEKDMIFEGFVGIIDPPRPEAAVAIKKARAAGIRTVMITGDHKATATAIARELGIIAASEGVLTGVELNNMSQEQLEESIEFYSVYARVSPEDKIRIVKAWQKRGEVVSMTGDGVNDAPALSAADVGVAMGINGTEVSKSAASMILMDDKFSTIIEAVSEGRNVFSNIRKLIYFLLVCNFSEIIVMLFAQFVGWQLPLTPIMLLLINVLCDGIPGMSLAKERSDARIMKRKPIGRNESFFAAGILDVILRQTFVFAIVTLSAYYIGYHLTLVQVAPTLEIARTMAFLVTGITSILHVLTVRSRKNIYKYRIKENPQMYLSILIMICLMILCVIIPPAATALGFSSMTWVHWLITIGLCLAPTIVAEYMKFWDNLKLKQEYDTRVR